MFEEEMGWSLSEIKSIIFRYPYLISRFEKQDGKNILKIEL